MTSSGGAQANGMPASEDGSSAIWTLLPGFDLAVEDPREYRDKVTFLHRFARPRTKGCLRL